MAGRGHRLKLRLVTALVFAGAGSASYAAAASLGIVSGPLAAGTTAVPACDTDGFTYTRALDASHDVAQVTVSGINAACAGGTLVLTLTDSSAAAIGSGSGAVTSSGYVTVSIDTPPPAASVMAYHVAITS